MKTFDYKLKGNNKKDITEELCFFEIKSVLSYFLYCHGIDISVEMWYMDHKSWHSRC